MGTQRTSNKDVMEAVSELTEAVKLLIAAQGAAIAPSEPTQVATTKVVAPTSPKVKINADYKAKMEPAWQNLADKRGTTVVGFAYRKRDGKPGLWGCNKADLAAEAAKYGERFLGAIGEYHPTK